MTRPVIEPSEMGRDLCAVLDPLMTAHGFQAGQWGLSPSSVGVVYCSPHAEFRARFPDLAPDIDYSDDGACTDLNIDVELGAIPRVGEVHLDGHGLDELLRDVGRHDLGPDVGSLPHLHVDEGVERLRDVLTVIFARATRSSTPGERDSDA